MLRIANLAGEELARIPLDELTDVKSLKQLLQRTHGFPPRFRQQLLLNEKILDDAFKLETPVELQLVLLTFSSTSQPQTHELTAASTVASASEVESMLQARHDPNLADPLGMTPLAAASHGGHVETARLLLEAEADINVSSNGVTPLMFACRRGYNEVVQLLLEARADTNFASERGVALSLACGRGNLAAARLLLQAGANKNAMNGGATALMIASAWGETEVVSLLLETRADPNLVGPVDGTTALISATRHGSADVVFLLLKAGADTDIQTKAGKTALMEAIEASDSVMIELLRESR
ncbi:Ankyrin repeat domain-containing protein 29 [Symbiodinium microadriaticum]|uniref:Ankyrin repeat domain-containing protein 29 n=1 Tax=Symbiodinium microadriaticum TaxID=2951 RepID=A0A1Q9E7M2_SYMMI|nr:Ankyrin repeat domain-containing protein 29 [Symbiodinium microadriaticum]CAE7273585.1 warA [Symbiodinium sp. KB8]